MAKSSRERCGGSFYKFTSEYEGGRSLAGYGGGGSILFVLLSFKLDGG